MKRILTYCLLTLCGLFNSAAAQVDLSSVVNEIKNTDEFRHAEISVFIKDLDTQTQLIEHNADQYRMPASTLKIKTVWDAWRILGPDYQFQTEMIISGLIDDHILYGNIYLIGGGDPTCDTAIPEALLYTSVGEDLIRALRELGITCVNGSIVVDASHFSLPGRPPGYLIEDAANYYGAGVYGLNVHDNWFPIELDRQEDGVRVKSFDKIAVDKVTADVIAVGTRDLAYAYTHPENRRMHIIGSLPQGRGSYTIKAAIPNPPHYVASILQDKIESSGIVINNPSEVAWTSIDDLHNVLWRKIYSSPTVSELLKPILHKSHNLYAETLYRECMRINPEAMTIDRAKIVDGSGLSPSNLITAKQMMSILSDMRRHPDFQDIIEYIPRNGMEGTVKHVLSKYPGQFYIKSGSISGVRCYVGFHHTVDNRWIGIVLFANQLLDNGINSQHIWEKILLNLIE